MRNARSGIATFLPLDTISAKPIDDKYRSFSRNARLGVDIVVYETHVEKAVHHVCGNAMICDTVDVAKYICYEKGQEVKAVTLDGTVFHKTGLITGGAQAAAGGRRWEEGQIQGGRMIFQLYRKHMVLTNIIGLKRLEENLRTQLAEIAKNRPRSSQDELLTSEITRLESELTVTNDDLSAIKTRLSGIRSELSVVNKQDRQLSSQLENMVDERSVLEESIQALRSVIDEEELEVFADFCERVGISDIREYEERQLKQAQEEGELGLKFKTQMSRLQHQ